MKRLVSFMKEEDYLISELDNEGLEKLEPNGCFTCFTITRCIGFKSIWDDLNCPSKCTLA